MLTRVRRIRVYVVDDNPSVRDSLRALLSAHGFEVVPCVSADDFLARHAAEVPACLLIDIRMPGMNGLELQTLLRDRGIPIPIIILTAHGDVPAAVRAMKAGAIDFIEKPASEDQLILALDHAADALAHRQAVPTDAAAERLARLTAREREVLEHLVLGETNKAIAEGLGISQRTIEIHRARVREKLGARGLSDLIRLLR